jgi:hypothetical protein
MAMSSVFIDSYKRQTLAKIELECGCMAGIFGISDGRWDPGPHMVDFLDHSSICLASSVNIDLNDFQCSWPIVDPEGWVASGSAAGVKNCEEETSLCNVFSQSLL